jgi:thiamine biosynthesis lipoprotein ApbE
MTFRSSLGSACAFGTLLIGLACRGAVAADTFVFHHEDVMGTSMELRLLADSEELARRAEDRALREIDRLSAIFSSYDPESEFSRWLAEPRTPVRIAPELFEVLKLCDRWRTASGGAFDPRVEALMRLWSRCAKEGRTPTPAEIADARASIDQPAWRLDTAAMTAERLSDGPLTLNAIAKGYIVERACRAAMEDDVRGVLLNVGGDLRVCGALDRTIGIADPRADSETSEPIAYIAVRDKAVSTSGSSHRGFRINGRWYSHKLDPQSGAPVERIACATVIADRSADADALATIFNMLAPEESVRLARTIPGVECLIVSTDGRVTRSDGWSRYERPATGSRTPEQEPKKGRAGTEEKPSAEPDSKKGPAVATSWGDAFELLVRLEINRPNTGKRRYQRPYLAVWVEDKNGLPVRTLTLWVTATKHGSQWIPDLRRWYRTDQARRREDETDLVATVARPTRASGQYDIIWDGKDDQGKPVGSGEYTLFIEAAREHGTYQIIQQAIRIDDRPFSKTLKGNIEVKAASVEYRRRTSTQPTADQNGSP